MMSQRQNYPIELLAPARDLSSGERAIDCGADAVYIGSERFSAREQAGNTLADIARLCDYAHKFWVRVYVAVNTLLYDHELAQAVDLIRDLYDMGADAIIIQDVGLLECALAPIPLIASTQMHNHTMERVRFLEQVGLSRVILARELSLEQIKAIRQETTIELECFVHGALCVGYSGQCYLSYALGGRSGNRGQCAQPCRKVYTLQDAHGKVIADHKHLLSLKDLNATSHLQALIDAGVTSFKIEGRLKDTAYVMNVVSYYRQQLDAIIAQQNLKRASSGISLPDFKPDINKTFNRGFTDYFLHQRDTVAALATPKFVGEALGKIDHLGNNYFTLKTSHRLIPGDGICFFDSGRRLQGTQIIQVQGEKNYPDKMQGLAIGLELYRNHDHAFLRSVEKSRTQRKIRLRMGWSETADGFRLQAWDEEDNTVSIDMPIDKVIADKAEQAQQQIRTSLTKLGTTDFICEQLTLNTDRHHFLPLSRLNALRRQLIERLVSERERCRIRHTARRAANEVPFPHTSLDYRGNVLNEKARAFYQRHGVVYLSAGAESGLDLTGEIVMTSKYCLRFELGLCGALLSQKGYHEPLVLIDEEQNRLQLRFDCHECTMNLILESRTSTRKNR